MNDIKYYLTVKSFRFSLIHASYLSRGQSLRVRDEWFSRANNPELIEHCLGFQTDDLEVRTEYGIGLNNSGLTLDGKTKFITTAPQNSPSAVRNWNAAASISTGRLILGIADDLIPTNGWDSQLWDLVEKESKINRIWKLTDSRCVVLNDKKPDDILPRHPLITRSLYEKYGYYFDPRFVSVGPDHEWLFLSLKYGFLRDARQVKLHHSLGPILDSQGIIECGCSSISNSSINKNSTSGQKRMHEDQWVKLAQTQLATWNKFWRILEWVAVKREWADQVLKLYEKNGFKPVKPVNLIFLMIFRSNLSLIEKLKLLKGIGLFIKEF